MLSTYKLETYEDILKALREGSGWLEELRGIILTEELITFLLKFLSILDKKCHVW